MAKIEDLIREIPDPNLRAEIAGEVAALKAGKKFGLVFEEHMAEEAQLPGLPAKVGARVAKRNARTDSLYRVMAGTNDSKCRIALEPNGREELVDARELVVVKRLGEPIFPALVPIDRVTRSPGRPYHTIINGENFHALQLLLYCYAGQVDLIYIDPPYNTGARDWKYNNDYVDKADRWRHSKWLAMMSRRLRLARRLLKPDTGVLIVTIDEHEVHHLGMLLEHEFPNTYRQMVTIVINQKGIAQGRLSRAEEYAFFCFTKDAYVEGHHDDLLSPDRTNSTRFTTPRWEWLLRGGTNSRRADRPGLFFPIFVDTERRFITRIGDPLPLDKSPDLNLLAGDRSVAWPIRTDGSLGNWRVSPPTLRNLVAKGYVRLGGYDETRKTWTVLYLGKKAQTEIETGVIRIARRNPETNVVDLEYVEAQERQIKTVWHRGTHDAGIYGSSLLRSILGEGAQFSFPKSVYAVYDAIATVVRDKPNALILDFFAGSGTTLHATCLLNADEGGQRQCILVTNNEVPEKLAKQLRKQGYLSGDPEFEKHGICESVTWPRCKYAVKGSRDDGTELPGEYHSEREMKAGFEENLEYFRLDFLDPDEVAYGGKFDSILPILWLMAGARGERKSARGYGKWFIPKSCPYAILIKEEFFNGFKDKLSKRPDITHVFLVTDSEEAYREMLADLPDSLETRMLYKSYLDNFRINIEKNL